MNIQGRRIPLKKLDSGGGAILSGNEFPQDRIIAPLYALIFDSINMSNRETDFSFDQNPIP